MNPEIVQSQSWRYKTIVVIKRQQQTTISNKQTILLGRELQQVCFLQKGC